MSIKVTLTAMLVGVLACAAQVTLAAAPDSDSLPVACPWRGSHVVRSNGQVTVFTHARNPGVRLACLPGRASFILNAADLDVPGSYLSISQIRLAGRFISFDQPFFSGGSFYTQTVVADLWRGRADYIALAGGDPGTFLDSYFLARDGAAVVVSETPRYSGVKSPLYLPHTPIDIYKLDRHGYRLLDRSPTIDTRSVALRNHLLTWKDAGQNRHAQVHGPIQGPSLPLISAHPR